MNCVILAAGYATRLYPLTQNFPKPLLTVGGKTIADRLIDDLDATGSIERFVVVTNAKFYDQFCQWRDAKARGEGGARPSEAAIEIVNDGTLTNETRLGAVKDILLAIEQANLQGDLLVLAGDNVLDFSLSSFLDYFDRISGSAVMRYWEPSATKLRKCGVLEIADGDRVLKMTEKPKDPSSNWCCPPFYAYRNLTASKIRRALSEGCEFDAPGSLVSWLAREEDVRAMEMPGRRYDVGNLEAYRKIDAEFASWSSATRKRAFKPFDPKKRYLITGAAGFIGFHLARRLLDEGARVVGYDNVNDYYDPALKQARLNILRRASKFTFVKGDLADRDPLEGLFKVFRPEIVVNLAAQAGVRYSITNPDAYVSSNVVGFFNVLEACRKYPAEHLLYASSSSVYGNRERSPFSTEDKTDDPISLYAATKKSNELFAYSYSHLYNIPCTGLRFFTVYGPYGRPDMAAFIFVRKILNDEPIQLFNNGDMLRDFTYVDDIVQGIVNMLANPPKPNAKGDRAKVYNIGNDRPEKLTDMVAILEKLLGKTAKKEFLPMQPGDVHKTCADVSRLEADFGFRPATKLADGMAKFVEWYRSFYNV